MKLDLLVLSVVMGAFCSPAFADSRIAQYCGESHVNELVAAQDASGNPDGFYVQSLQEQVSTGNARIIVTTGDEFHLCTRTAATPDMDTNKQLLLIDQRRVKYLFVPIRACGVPVSS